MSKDWRSKDGAIAWLEKERLVDNFFKVDRITLKHALSDGSMSPALDRMLLDRPDAVAAIVVNTDRRVMYFVRQFRVGAAAKGDPPWMVECAAGLVDEGEDKEEAVLREIKEELGFAATQAQELMTIYTSAAIISERIFLYYIEVTDAQRVADGGGLDDEHEDIEILEVPLDELPAFRDEAGVTDCKTMIGVDWYLRTKM